MPSHPPNLRRARPRVPHIHRRVTQFEQLRVFFPSKVPAFRALLTQSRAYARGRLPTSGCPLPGKVEVFLGPTHHTRMRRDVGLFEVFFRSCGFTPLVGPSGFTTRTCLQVTMFDFSKIVRGVTYTAAINLPHVGLDSWA